MKTKLELIKNYPVESLKNWGDYFGYPEAICKEMISMVSDIDWQNAKIAILDDFGFQMIRYLINTKKVPLQNIYFLVSENDETKVELMKKWYSNFIENEVFSIYNINMSFDLIIANPPFQAASKITQATVELAKQSVWLMPFGKYKKYDLFQYVSSVLSVDESCFVDAAQDIQPNLLICKLQNTRDESKKLIDMEKNLWNQDFGFFYEKNEKIPASFQSFVYNNKDRDFVEKNLEKILFIPYWPHVGNAQKEKSVTRKANLGEKESLERILKSNASYSYFLFGSKLEKENAFKFWVSNLCNELLLGCLTRATILKFPHVDWSRTWTDKEIIAEFNPHF